MITFTEILTAAKQLTIPDQVRLMIELLQSVVSRWLNYLPTPQAHRHFRSKAMTSHTLNPLPLPIVLPQSKIIDFCQRWQITQLSVFGSIIHIMRDEVMKLIYASTALIPAANASTDRSK